MIEPSGDTRGYRLLEGMLRKHRTEEESRKRRLPFSRLLCLRTNAEPEGIDRIEALLFGSKISTDDDIHGRLHCETRIIGPDRDNITARIQSRLKAFQR
jgi:hypothetical protein